MEDVLIRDAGAREQRSGMSMQAIGAYLRGLRKGSGLTLLEASSRSAQYMLSKKGIEPSYIKKIEDGTSGPPSIAHVIALVRGMRGSLVMIGRLFVNPEPIDVSENWGLRHAQFIASDTEWMKDLSTEDQERLRALFEADNAAL